MLNNTLDTILEHIRQRWMFLAAFAAALGLLTAAYLVDSVALAAVGAIAAFMAGEERGGQVLCNDCARAMVPVDPEIPEPYRVP